MNKYRIMSVSPKTPMKAHYRAIYKWKLEPFSWGRSDCMIAIADYLHDLTGIDPAVEYRGLYDDAMSCQRVTGFLTDPIGLFTRCVANIPLLSLELQHLRAGDVGLIDVGPRYGHSIIGGVYLGSHTRNWAARGKSGVIIGRPAEILAAWSIGPWRTECVV